MSPSFRYPPHSIHFHSGNIIMQPFSLGCYFLFKFPKTTRVKVQMVSLHLERSPGDVCAQECRCSLPGGGRPSFMLNAVAKIPKGNAPIPNDIWKPPSPNPKPWKPCKENKNIKVKNPFNLLSHSEHISIPNQTFTPSPTPQSPEKSSFPICVP